MTQVTARKSTKAKVQMQYLRGGEKENKIKIVQLNQVNCTFLL